jgi:hypothetical protein
MAPAEGINKDHRRVNDDGDPSKVAWFLGIFSFSLQILRRPGRFELPVVHKVLIFISSSPVCKLRGPEAYLKRFLVASAAL